MAQKQTQIEQVTAYARSMDRKPFTYKDVMRDLGLGKARAIMTMRRLKEAGLIQPIGQPRQGIYRLAPVLNKYEGAGPDDWTPSEEKLERIRKYMMPGAVYTAGEISQQSGVPERTLYRYLECLVYLRVVAVRPNASGSRFVYYRTGGTLGQAPQYKEFRGILRQIREEWEEVADAEREL